MEPPRRTAWAEGVDRLRAAATTEPGRLRLIGAVLAALVLAFGAVTAWQVSDRSAAAADVVGQSQPLSDDAASVYRSLADADTTAAAGFLSGGQWPAEIRERYETDIEVASELLVTAAANTEGSAASRRGVAELNSHLTAYTGLVEQARANNRQGLPLGGAYLRHANERMRTDLLPAARSLYEAETDRLGEDYADARSWPWAALALGVLALAALGWAQRRVYLRTNRVFNQGLLAATAACAVLLLWLAVGHGVARSGLGDSREHGAESLRVLNEARIHSLTARGDESLTLVARGARLTGNGKDFYETSYAGGMRDLVGGPGEEAAPGSLLDRAGDLADDTEGRAPVRAAVEAVRTWQDRHREARKADDNGDYDGALRQVIGDRGTTGESFDEVDSSLDRAQAHERREFRAAADGGRRAFAGLPAGAAVFALLGAAAAVLGIGRRLSEYR
ncbi:MULTISPECIES: hypothetical protein [Streptomyces]|uniref:Secreted protein n=1 Tax=Streptomyces lycii TaxID=2654337 RepID=A0ABQ7FQH7_9ACTN|nr:MULTISPECIES: hypothetical protein [Streptomyces]KAF4411090.1 hypothetical protein GCU69_00405 [Streptomyces lycii]PGH50361.1 hypothetical protein CRI70_12515 [Streptomyces sp. Ru87]